MAPNSSVRESVCNGFSGEGPTDSGDSPTILSFLSDWQLTAAAVFSSVHQHHPVQFIPEWDSTLSRVEVLTLVCDRCCVARTYPRGGDFS